MSGVWESTSASAHVGEPFRPSLEITFRGHRQSVLAVAFEPSYRSSGMASAAPTSRSRLPPRVASGGADGALLVWDPRPTGRALRLSGHRGPVLGCAYSPRAPLLASCGHDGYVRLWLPSFRRGSGTCGGHFSTLAADGDSSSCGWHAHAGATRALAFAEDGTDHLFTVGDDKSVKCWDLNYASGGSRSGHGGNRFVGSFTSPASDAAHGHTNWVYCVAVQGARTTGGFHHYIASGGDDRTVQVWDERTRRPAHRFYASSGSVRGLSFHPDGHCLASADAGGTINVYDLRQSSSTNTSRRYGLLQHYASAHDGAVSDVTFSPNGGWLLSAGDDGAVKLWDAKEGYLYCTAEAHGGPVKACSFSDDGTHFASGGADKTVLLWRSGLPSYDAGAPSGDAERAVEIARHRLHSGQLSPPPPASPLGQQRQLGLPPMAPTPAATPLPTIEEASSSTAPRTPAGGVRDTAASQETFSADVGELYAEFVKPSERDGGLQECDRGFTRSEERFSHITPPPHAEEEAVSTPSSLPCESVPAAASAQSMMESRTLEARGHAYHAAQRESTVMQRLENLEEALAVLADHVQQQQIARETEVREVRKDLAAQLSRQRTEASSLKEMMATLIEQQELLMEKIMGDTKER